MKLHLSHASDVNRITGYGEGFVQVNGQRHESSLVVLPEGEPAAWEVAAFSALSADHFEALASQRPELVILGTGKRLCFPPPALYEALILAGIGLEVMDTGAACRTYNILAAEGRRVSAALIVE
jgi:uncharacterized protein